jgi:hypothetical protein
MNGRASKTIATNVTARFLMADVSLQNTNENTDTRIKNPSAR